MHDVFAFDLRQVFLSKRLNHETGYDKSLTKFVAKGSHSLKGFRKKTFRLEGVHVGI